MREINNTPANGINPVPQVKKAETPAVSQETSADKQTKEIKDLANNPAESLGRSQVAPSDNLENDLKVFLDSANDPEKLKKVSDNIANATKFYDLTAGIVGEEKALSLMKAYADEFAK